MFITVIQVRKPLMEKKRRERINHSLNELKRLIIEASSKVSGYIWIVVTIG